MAGGLVGVSGTRVGEAETVKNKLIEIDRLVAEVNGLVRNIFPKEGSVDRIMALICVDRINANSKDLAGQMDVVIQAARQPKPGPTRVAAIHIELPPSNSDRPASWEGSEHQFPRGAQTPDED